MADYGPFKDKPTGGATGGATGNKKRKNNNNKNKQKTSPYVKPTRPPADPLSGSWDPATGATINPFEGGYFDDASTYGAGKNIVGAPTGRGKGKGKSRGNKAGNAVATDNVFTADERAFSGTDPETWAKTWLGGDAGGGLSVDGNSAFGKWFANELSGDGGIIDAWNQAAGEGMNPNLSFASFLQTLGLGDGGTATDLLRHRWRAALPSATGYSDSANGAGPTRWSVW